MVLITTSCLLIICKKKNITYIFSQTQFDIYTAGHFEKLEKRFISFGGSLLKTEKERGKERNIREKLPNDFQAVLCFRLTDSKLRFFFSKFQLFLSMLLSKLKWSIWAERGWMGTKKSCLFGKPFSGLICACSQIAECLQRLRAQWTFWIERREEVV